MLNIIFSKICLTILDRLAHLAYIIDEFMQKEIEWNRIQPEYLNHWHVKTVVSFFDVPFSKSFLQIFLITVIVTL